MEKNRRDMKLFLINWSKLVLIASLSILIAMFGCGGDSGGDDDDDGDGGGGGSEYSLNLGTWSGDDISFTVTEGSYYVNNLSVTYRGYADGTICNYNYEVTSTLGTRILVTNNTFSYEESSLTISGEFLSETSVEVDISWSSFDTTCNATESGNTLLVANSDTGGNDIEDIDDDGDNFTENQGDCDDTNSDINPDSDETCNDNIDNDCDGDTDYDDDDCGGEAPQTFSVYSIPDADINIDGNSDDWNELEPVFMDDIDDQYAGADVDGSDLHKLYIAKDDMHLYIMIVLWDGPPVTDIATNYIFEANELYGVPLGSNDFRTWSSSKGYSVEGWWANAGINEDTYTEYDQTNIGTGANFIEWRILLPEKDALNDKYVSAVTHVFDCDKGSPGCEQLPVNDENFPPIQLKYEPNLLTNIDIDDDGFTEMDGDCDDDDASVNPGATEICDDAKDNDCNGDIDCTDSSCSADPSCQTCTDADIDGYYAESGCGTEVDCDDTDSDIYPGAEEIPGDGIDQDCDGNDLFVISQGDWSGSSSTDDTQVSFTVSGSEITQITLSFDMSSEPTISAHTAIIGGSLIGTDNTFSSSGTSTYTPNPYQPWNTKSIIYSFSGMFTHTSMCEVTYNYTVGGVPYSGTLQVLY